MVAQPEDLYIPPITKICSSFAEAKEFFDKLGGVSYFDTDKQPPQPPQPPPPRPDRTFDDRVIKVDRPVQWPPPPPERQGE